MAIPAGFESATHGVEIRRSCSNKGLPPHTPHAGANIYLGSLAVRTCRIAGRHNWPSGPLEQVEKLFGNEAGSRGVEVAIAPRMLAANEETLRHDQMEGLLNIVDGCMPQT